MNRQQGAGNVTAGPTRPAVAGIGPFDVTFNGRFTGPLPRGRALEMGESLRTGRHGRRWGTRNGAISHPRSTRLQRFLAQVGSGQQGAARPPLAPCRRYRRDHGGQVARQATQGYPRYRMRRPRAGSIAVECRPVRGFQGGDIAGREPWRGRRHHRRHHRAVGRGASWRERIAAGLAWSGCVVPAYPHLGGRAVGLMATQSFITPLRYLQYRMLDFRLKSAGGPKAISGQNCRMTFWPTWANLDRLAFCGSRP